MARSWRKRFAPWAQIFSWWSIGLVLEMRDLDSVWAHLDDLRAIGLPLVLEIKRGSNAPDVCMFDDAFTRMAWMRKDTTVENASWGPGLGEDVYHWRDLIVWRLSDRKELYNHRGFDADWIAVEVRGDAAYATSGELIVGGLGVDEMTFDEAIAAPGRKVQIVGDEVKDGARVMMIYRLGEEGAKQLAWRRFPESRVRAVVADLSKRGLEVAESDFFCDFVWVSTAQGLEVYDSKQRVLDASGERALLEDGRTLARADIARVVAFAESDYIFRGVKAELRSGKEVLLVTEASGAAMGDPTYSRNELICETVWTATIGRAIAAWAGVTFVDLI